MGLLLLLTAACTTDARLQPVTAGVELLDTGVDFGRVYTGDALKRSVRLHNTGGATEVVVLRTQGSSAFRAGPEKVILGPAATAEVTVNLTVRSAGALEGQLLFFLNDGPTLVAPLKADARQAQSCGMPDPCTDARFDRDAGICVTAKRDEGAACVSPNKCLSQTTCQSGDCRGAAISCDDHNVCTDDSCDPAVGCVHASTANRCKASGPCKVAFCDPVNGCGERDAADGTVCGVKNCSEKNLCRQGVCVKEAVHDGEACGYAGPCQDEGVCQATACVQPKLNNARRRFAYDAKEPGNGRPALAFAPLVDADGRSYFGERTSGGVVIRSLDGDGKLRWSSEALEPSDSALQEAGNHLLEAGRVLYLTSSCALVTLDGATGTKVSSLPLSPTGGDARELTCTSMAQGPLGGLAVAGLGCQSGLADCQPFVGLIGGDGHFTYKLFGKPGKGPLSVGPLAWDETSARLMTPVVGGEHAQLLSVGGDLGSPWWSAWDGRGLAVAVAGGTLAEDGQGAVLETKTGKRIGTLAMNPGLPSGSGPIMAGGRTWALHWECPQGGCNGNINLMLRGYDAAGTQTFVVQVATAQQGRGNAVPYASLAFDRAETLYVAMGDIFKGYTSRWGMEIFSCPLALGTQVQGPVTVGMGTVFVPGRDGLVGVDVGWARPPEHGWTRTGGSERGLGAAQ